MRSGATDPKMTPAKDGVGLDGIPVKIKDGNLYVTTYIPAALFKIAVKDGKAGAVTALKTLFAPWIMRTRCAPSVTVYC